MRALGMPFNQMLEGVGKGRMADVMEKTTDARELDVFIWEIDLLGYAGCKMHHTKRMLKTGVGR